jgi:hypothetical protein
LGLSLNMATQPIVKATHVDESVVHITTDRHRWVDSGKLCINSSQGPKLLGRKTLGTTPSTAMIAAVKLAPAPM